LKILLIPEPLLEVYHSSFSSYIQDWGFCAVKRRHEKSNLKWSLECQRDSFFFHEVTNV
jgi:hypothetical protein